MRKEKIVTKEVLMCDACEITLEEDTDTYITMDSFDLCNKCASKILKSIPIPTEKLAPMVYKLAEDSHSLAGFGFTKKEGDSLKDFNKTIFTNPAETDDGFSKPYVHSEKGPPYPTQTYDIDTSKTTGITEMIPATSTTLSVPKIRTSDLTNLGDL